MMFNKSMITTGNHKFKDNMVNEDLQNAATMDEPPLDRMVYIVPDLDRDGRITSVYDIDSLVRQYENLYGNRVRSPRTQTIITHHDVKYVSRDAYESLISNKRMEEEMMVMRRQLEETMRELESTRRIIETTTRHINSFVDNEPSTSRRTNDTEPGLMNKAIKAGRLVGTSGMVMAASGAILAVRGADVVVAGTEVLASKLIPIVKDIGTAAIEEMGQLIDKGTKLIHRRKRNRNIRYNTTNRNIRYNTTRNVINYEINSQGRTTVHRAVEENNKSDLRMLIAAGANVDKADKNGKTPLWIASEIGREDIVRMLIDAGAYVNMAEFLDGKTPIYIATEKKHEEIVRLLIAAGADVNKVNERRKTPLWKAVHRGHRKIAKILREAGGRISIK